MRRKDSVTSSNSLPADISFNTEYVSYWNRNNFFRLDREKKLYFQTPLSITKMPRSKSGVFNQYEKCIFQKTALYFCFKSGLLCALCRPKSSQTRMHRGHQMEKKKHYSKTERQHYQHQAIRQTAVKKPMWYLGILLNTNSH